MQVSVGLFCLYSRSLLPIVTGEQYWNSATKTFSARTDSASGARTDSASKTFKTQKSVAKDTQGLVLEVFEREKRGTRIEFHEPFSQTGWVPKDHLCCLHR